MGSKPPAREEPVNNPARDPSDASVKFAVELMLIGERREPAQGGQTIDVINPATKEVIAAVPRGQAVDVDRAVQAARAAFGSWARLAARQRGRQLLMIADELDKHAERIARTTSMETGNAIRTQSRPEVAWAADVLRYFGSLASEAKGETLPLGETFLSYSRREPLGVVGAIIPWNSPVILAAMKIAMAVSMGNTIVLKAAEDAPLAAIGVAEICAQQLPPGVVNVVTGYGDEAGAALAMHPLVQKLSFTGSTEVGKEIMSKAAQRVVPVSLELGGKSPNIVFADALDDNTVQGVISAMRFTRQGQSCTAGSRLFVHASIFDEFVGRLTSSLAGLKVGDPLDEAIDMGALINERQFRRVCGYIDDGLAQGAHVALGGLPPATGPLSKGYYAIPTVLTDVDPSWRIAREEIFGPVLVAIPWTSVDAVVDLANDSHYGLAAFIWTRDVNAGIRVAHRLETGWIQINRGLGQIVGMSYGGYKESGIGREFSIEGALEEFTQRKSITVDLDFHGRLN